MQNRKSAKKCRLKKKAEFNCMQDEYDRVIKENSDLKNQVRYNKLLWFRFLGESDYYDAVLKNWREFNDDIEIGIEHLVASAVACDVIAVLTCFGNQQLWSQQLNGNESVSTFLVVIPV